MDGLSRLTLAHSIVLCRSDLLLSERDQHAKDDNSDFARELAPAMQRLRQMKMHAALLEQLR